MQHDPHFGDLDDSDDEGITQDQRAVNAYLASRQYERRVGMRPTYAANAWVLDQLEIEDPGLLSRASFWSGLLGLNALVLFTGFATPFALEALGPAMGPGRSNYIVMLIVLQTLMFPPLITFAFATVTPMFWYGSVVVRFVAAVLSVSPGCLAFYAALAMMQGSPPDDFVIGFSIVMFSMFLAAGTVALAVQMWSPWALSQARPDDSALPPIGTRAFMELTGVAALGYAIFVAVETDEYVVGLLFFGGFGLISSIAVICVAIAFLRQGKRNSLAAIVSVLCAFFTACLFSGTFAAMEFGWESIYYNFFLVSGVSIYGALVICAVMWVCLWWLRSCGWTCVSRHELNRPRPPMEEASQVPMSDL